MIKPDAHKIPQKLFSQQCKIAYLGNSVTAQKNGYRTYLHELICKHTQQQHIAINAGIGGVGSLASAFLLSDFVLRKKPDLCFVECAIADAENATPREFIQLSIDSILWQLNKARIPACMLYLYKDKQPTYYRKILQQEYAPVTNHYNTSIIDIYPQMMELVNDQKYQSIEILTDGVHTTELGAILSAEFILKELFDINHLAKLKLDKSYRQDSFLYPQIIKPEVIGAENLGSFIRGKFKLIIPYLEISHGPTLYFTVKDGETIGILLVADNDSGVMDIRCKNFHHAAQVHDAWCSKARLQVLILPESIKANEAFSIKLSKNNIAKFSANLQSCPWKKIGTNLKIIGLLVNRSEDLLEPNFLW